MEKERVVFGKKQMGIHVEGAIFNYDGSDIDLEELLMKLESVGLELGASTQPMDEEGNFYTYTKDWKVGEPTEKYKGIGGYATKGVGITKNK